MVFSRPSRSLSSVQSADTHIYIRYTHTHRDTPQGTTIFSVPFPIKLKEKYTKKFLWIDIIET